MKSLSNQTEIKFALRIPAKLYREVAKKAEEWREAEGVGSINAWILRAMRQGLGVPAEEGILGAGERPALVEGGLEHPAIYKEEGGRLVGPRKNSAEAEGVEAEKIAGEKVSEESPAEDVNIFDQKPGMDWELRARRDWPEMEPGAVQADIDELLAAMGKKRPKDWKTRNAAQRLEWLKKNA